MREDSRQKLIGSGALKHDICATKEELSYLVSPPLFKIPKFASPIFYVLLRRNFIWDEIYSVRNNTNAGKVI